MVLDLYEALGIAMYSDPEDTDSSMGYLEDHPS